MIDTGAALAHFSHTDPVMAAQLSAALQAVPPLACPTPKTPPEYFASITSSIISQQISVKAAASILARVKNTVGELTPAHILEVSPEDLRAAGLSGQKVKYITHNAAIWHEIPSGNFVSMDDEAVIQELTKLYGIGRWTAEMFLMFSLARPDVFSFGDLGLMQGLFQMYPTLKKHHVRKIESLLQSWSPHRTTAALTLWYHKDNGPVLL